MPNRELKQRTPAFSPIAEANEPHPDNKSAFKQPILPVVPPRTPASITQTPVRPVVANLTPVAQDPVAE
jgi:hypothetical protein